MSKTYRVIALVLVAVVALSVFGLAAAGCKKGLRIDPRKIGLVFDIGGLGDKSFNDSAYEGLVRADEDFDIETTYLEPSEGGENREELLRSLAEEGYGLIFGNGFLFTDSLAAVAADFPETMFGLVDGYIADLTEASNVVCMGFAEHEGSFLVGVAAAMKTRTNKVGFIGGMEIDLIKKFEAGFKAGVAYVNKNIRVITNYIGSTGEAFKNAPAGRELALAQYDQGADVIYHASGQSGLGVIAAAAQVHKWVIGVDSDQYLTASPEEQPWILTSMIKRVDVAVYETIEAFTTGQWQGGYAVFDLEVDGVGYSLSNPDALTEDIVAAIDEAKAKIVSGEIVVPATLADLETFLAGLD